MQAHSAGDEEEKEEREHLMQVMEHHMHCSRLSYLVVCIVPVGLGIPLRDHRVISTRSASLRWDEAALGMQARRGSHEAAGPREAEEGKEGAPAQGASLLRAVTGGFAQEVGALREGMAYITAPENRRALLTGTAQT